MGVALFGKLNSSLVFRFIKKVAQFTIIKEFFEQFDRRLGHYFSFVWNL
jgi:hypothetical protein